MIRLRKGFTRLRHNSLLEEYDEVLNFIKTVRECSHIIAVGTLGGVSTYDCDRFFVDNLYVDHNRF